jgi:large subunit ribosomal protein L30
MTEKTGKRQTGATGARLKVQYYRSSIGFTVHQKQVVRGLGFLKLNTTRDLPDTPEIRGMIAKVPHLVRIVE